MPYFVAVKPVVGGNMSAEVYKVVLKARIAGVVETRNVFYVQVEDNAYVAAEVATWMSSIITPINGYIANIWVAYGIDLYVHTGGHWVLSSENGFAHAGGASTQMMPYQTAAVIVAKTIIPRCMPKKFWGAITEATSTNGLLDAGALIALASSASAWVSPFTGATSSAVYTPGTYSEKHEEFISFVGFVVDNILGTQRRRKPGVGI